ncbi:MAG: ice-binding family protein [Lautropia sp.]
MNYSHSLLKSSTGFLFALLTAMLAGCGGGMDPVLGAPGAGVAPGAPNNPAPPGAPAAPKDTTRPTVILTAPAPGATDVATNRKVTAVFSEDMSASTISGNSFTVANTALGSPVAGTVSYSVAARTATFTPSGSLAINTPFTATVTMAATDLAGNALAGNTAAVPAPSNHVWSFTTGAAADTIAPTISSVAPADGSTGVCLTRSVSATFSEAMDAATISTATFSVTDNGVAVPGTVTYDAASQQARFVPTNAAGFAASKPLVATILSGGAGVKDLGGNPLASNRVWGFTTGTQPCQSGVDLRSAAPFGAFGGGAGVTNQGINTVVNGDLGTTAACTLITGFHDFSGTVYTETPLNVGAVNGSIYCAPPAPGTATTMAIATQARADARTAFNELAAKPPGSDPGAGQLGGLVLLPGTYTAAGGTFAVTTGNLTLDAQGDANAVWVFQSSSSLTVGMSAIPRTVLLVNGAQARNVFWQVGSAARIENGSTMTGTIIAAAGVTISTSGESAQTTLTGRALGLDASVTMVNTTIVAP